MRLDTFCHRVSFGGYDMNDPPPWDIGCPVASDVLFRASAHAVRPQAEML